MSYVVLIPKTSIFHVRNLRVHRMTASLGHRHTASTVPDAVHRLIHKESAKYSFDIQEELSKFILHIPIRLLLLLILLLLLTPKN